VAATLVDSRGKPIPPGPLGVILLPNIDVDGRRRLPAKVEPATDRRLRLDHEIGAKSRLDDDLLALGVRLDAATDPAHAVVSLRIEGPLQDQFAVLDSKKNLVRKRATRDATFTLALRGSRSATVFLETAALRGTPLARSTGEPTHLVLVLDGVDQQRVPLTIAPFLLDSNLGVAERIYICEIEDELGSNFPSLDEVNAALARTGVPIIKIPMDVNLGDAWIQDQIQTGFCHAPAGIERVVLHCPRSRSNVIQTGPLVNLKEFARQHFPSRDFGLFDSFWRRRLGTIEDAAGAAQPLVFENSYEIHLRMESIQEAWSAMSEAFEAYSERSGVSDPQLSFIFNKFRNAGMHFVLLHRRLPNVHRMLERYFSRLSGLLGADLLAQQLAVDRALIRQKVRAGEENVKLVMTARGERFKIKRKDEPAAFLDPTASLELFGRLAVMHDSTNYGGNIEVSPPVKGAPLGKAVVGSVAERPMDPDLEGFFFDQQIQPVIAIDTSWLGVAHVDEVMTFVPAESAPGFAIPFASPGKAIEILTTAREVKRAATVKGADLAEFFLTGVLRGKLWLYHYPKDGFDVTRPPLIHREARRGNYTEPGRGHSREYDAGLSVETLLDDVELETNALIQKEFIDPLADATLSVEFDGAEIVPLPVIFDEMAYTRDDTEEDSDKAARIVTSAYTPNLANLQVVDKVLLIPKPYGPRMGVKGAIETLKRCLDSRFHSRLTEDHFKKSGLLEVIHWDLGKPTSAPTQDPFAGGGANDPLGTQGFDIRPPTTDLQRIARQFNDGFLEGQFLMDEKIVEQKIKAANTKHFDASGRLLPGWHRLRIPERSVDLFEAVTRIRLEALGNVVRFVDSWHYHVRHGEIHCGTNVLRKPAPPVKWWELKQEAVSRSAAGGLPVVA
jgi:hypothetical protein